MFLYYFIEIVFFSQNSAMNGTRTVATSCGVKHGQCMGLCLLSRKSFHGESVRAILQRQ